MAQDYYVSIKCKKCNRTAGKIISGQPGESRKVGCKECGISSDVTLRDQQKMTTSHLDIDLGVYYPYCC